MHRREFIGLMGAGAGLALAPSIGTQTPSNESAPDATLHIAQAEIEIAPRRIMKTTAYNGSVPGPLLRFREDQRVTIEVFNDTKDPELVHWHGLLIPSEVDGSAEEGTPPIPPRSSKRYSFVARPAGTRWYHTHVTAKLNLNRGTYNGQFGMLYIEPKSNPGSYDSEVPLILHDWEPYLTGEEGGVEEVSYKLYSVNSRALGHGDPIRVREGQKVLFRILNASATLQHDIALPGHQFTVIGMDGNPVPVPRTVDVLSLGPAERIDAVVTMNAPGVWILGEVDDPMRNQGLGIVVEYENRNDMPKWNAPPKTTWDYTIFGNASNAAEQAAAGQVETVPLVFTRKFVAKWLENWMINGKVYPKTEPIVVRENHRYLLRMENRSDDDHPVHLHRHSFELKSVAGKNTAGIFKDVVVIPSMKTVEAELLANNPGETLFHCHNQQHMDFGFMTMMHYAE
jgi:FtsP/CotA-like multicopper oxidase with cupredoxin domain